MTAPLCWSTHARIVGGRWRYELHTDLLHRSDVPLPRGAIPMPVWMPYLGVRPTLRGAAMLIRADYRSDGPTGVPDAAGTVLAAVIHDACYQYARDLARAWGVSVRHVLIWADRVFREAMHRHGAAPIVAETYYAGVRVLGLKFWYVQRAAVRIGIAHPSPT